VDTEAVTFLQANCPRTGSIRLCTFAVDLTVETGDFIGWHLPSGQPFLFIDFTGSGTTTRGNTVAVSIVPGITVDFTDPSGGPYSVMGTGFP